MARAPSTPSAYEPSMTQPKMIVNDQPSDKVIAKLGGFSMVELDGTEYVYLPDERVIRREVLNAIVDTARRVR